MKLQQTSKSGKGKGSHYHFAYLDEKQGIGVTSTDNKHNHTLIFIPPQQAQIDSYTQVVLSEEVVGGWQVQEFDGHIHELGEIEFNVKEEKKEEKDIVKEVREMFKVSSGIEKEPRKLAEEAEDFYIGKQWSDADKNALKATERASLTINEIESKIDLLSGYQRQNRSDMRFYPVESGDGRIADILNVIVKNVVDQNDYEYEETNVFEDGSIVGRGHIHCYIDYENDLKGEIKIEHFPWKDIYLGPHDKKNASDCEYLIKAKWFSLGKVKQLWPDKANKISADWELLEEANKTPHVQYNNDQYGKSENTEPVIDSSFVNIAKKEYRVLECEQKVYKRIPIVVDTKNDFYLNIEGLTETQISSIGTIAGIHIVRKPDTRVKKTIIASNILLDEDYIEDGMFSIITFYAKKKGDKWWGKVEGVKDAQRELNKRHSQITDILNKVSAYGWFYDSSSFVKESEKEKFIKESAKPGFAIEVQNVNQPPKQVEGVRFPNELAGMLQIESHKIREIMNINLEMQGMARASQSGIAIVQQQKQGLIGNEFLFDNLNLAKKTLGRKLVKNIQKVYTPERMLRILQNRAAKETVEIGGKPLDQIDPNEILTILKDADLMKYDLTVASSGFNPTTRMSNFVMWAELAGKGAPVPPEVLIDLSDLPEKEKVKAAFAQHMQAEKEKENQKMYMELGKTLIAKGVDPRTLQAGTGTNAPS